MTPINKTKLHYKISAQSSDMVNIYLYGDIGDDSFFGNEDSITAKSFSVDLMKIPSEAILNIYINSNGGNVFDGYAIYSQLSRHAGKKNVFIDGVAASIASFIAMVGDTVSINENAFIMIHRAWGRTAGTATDMRKAADMLELIEGSLESTYAKKTKLSEDKIRELMAEETWMNASKALELGFVDEIFVGKTEGVKMSENTEVTNSAQPFQAGLSQIQAAEIVEECVKFGFPNMAKGFILAGSDLTEVKNKLQEAIQVKNLCVLAKSEGRAEGFIQQGLSPQEVRAALFDYLVKRDEALPLVNVNTSPTRSELPIETRCKGDWDISSKLRGEFGNDFSAFLAYTKAIENNQVKQFTVKSEK